MDNKEEHELKKELRGLFEMIQKIRREIASIKSPQDHFTDMTDQLDAIVGSTAIATNEILENVEAISDVSFALKKEVAAEHGDKLDDIINRTGNIIVSCSFQDLTGQRVSKVIKALQYIEDRINTLIAMWGQDKIFGEKVETATETDEYQKYLNGPALPGQGLGQSQADELFAATAAVATVATVAATATPVEAAPAPAPVEAAPAPAPVESAPAPTPAPTEEEPTDDAEPLGQNDIDALFD